VLELSAEMIAAGAAAIAGAGGTVGVVVRLAWERWRESEKRRERLPCETHTALMRGLADDLHDLAVDSKSTNAAVQKIEIHLATINGRIAKTEDKLATHMQDSHSHGGY